MLRGIREGDISKQNGRVNKRAFIPRRNGKDDDGLSVSQPNGENLEWLKARIGNTSGMFCSLFAGGIRGIKETDRTLEVCPNPTEIDAFHSLVLGVPTDLESTALATRLAQRLADISSVYEPPS
jgi:hypothetical protein